MDKPIVSVIIPCHNGAEHISGCLRCLRRQSYPALEILFVDDGSTDDSVRLAEQYDEVTVIRNERKRGPSYSRNRGIGLATGKYIHFLDVDDRISDHFYERLVEASERDGADMAFCDVAGRFRWANVFVRKYSYKHDKYKATCIIRHGYAWRYLIRRDLILRHRLSFPEGRLIEDLPFSVRAIYYASSVVMVPRAVYYYMESKRSLLGNLEARHLERVNHDWELSQQEVRLFANVHQIPTKYGGYHYGWQRLYGKIMTLKDCLFGRPTFDSLR